MKIKCIAVLLLVSMAAMAEDYAHNVGLHVGFVQQVYRLNQPSKLQDDREKLLTTSLNGPLIGMVYDGTIVKGFGTSIGVNYNFGMTYSDWDSYPYTLDGKKTTMVSLENRTKYVSHHGEVYVDWQYKFEIAKETYLIVYSGPTIQLGILRARDFYRLKLTGVETEVQSPIMSYDQQMSEWISNLNVTWGVGAGFQYKRYFLRGGYDFGLMNPYTKTTFSELDALYDGDDRLTRGRLDKWQIKLGCYFWQDDK